MTVAISTGSGAASVAAEAVGGSQYQQIEVLGQGGASTLGVNPDGSANASIIGKPTFIVGGGSILSVPTGSVIAVLQSSSIIAVAAGSVVSVPSGSILSVPTGSVITVIQNSSLLSVPVGSTITVWKDSSVLAAQSGTWNASVSGTTGASVIGNVNTTITSIAVANGGIPVWSPLGSRVQGTADLRTVQGGSVAVIAAQGVSSFLYVDHVQVLNFGSSSVLVTIADVTTSILGYTIAPAGGGSNYEAFYKTAVNNPITASLNGTASVLVSMQGFKSAT